LCKQFSWTGSARIDNISVIEAIAQGIQSIEERHQRKDKFIDKFLNSIRSIREFKELWHNFENQFIWPGKIAQLKKAERMLDSYKLVVEGILNLPVRLLQYKLTKDFLDKIYKELIKKISIEPDSCKKGHIFESLWLMERLQDTKAQFRFLINGMVVIDPEKPKDKTDENEFDVIDLFINRDGKAECWIYACSIADDYKENNENQLKKLAENIHKYYSKLIIRTRYVVPKDKAGNNWEPEVKDTGVGTWN